jgi:signal transduction histidine kinase
MVWAKTEPTDDGGHAMSDPFSFAHVGEQRPYFVLDPEAFMDELVVQLRAAVGADVGMFALRRASGIYETGGLAGTWSDSLAGLEVHANHGLGGRIIASEQPFTVDDYLQSPAISHQYDDAVRRESLVSMMAVPVTIAGHVAAVAYVGQREAKVFGDRSMDVALEQVQQTEAKFANALETENVAAVAVEAERNRAAQELHDSVGALLFAIEAGAKRLGEVASDSDVTDRAQEISTNAAAAGSALRQAIAGLVQPSEIATLAELQADVRAVEQRSGIMARLILPLGPPNLDGHRAETLVAVCRELLRNAERHSGADRITLSLFEDAAGLSAVVSDDGAGEAEHIVEGVGLSGCRTRLERLGGSLTYKSVPDEVGLTVKAWIPS